MSTPAHTQPKNPTTNRFECPYGACYRSFARRYNLVTHYNTHFGVRMWECGVCCRRVSVDVVFVCFLFWVFLLVVEDGVELKCVFVCGEKKVLWVV
ncbi:hypothetical protein BC832DRAFT_354359 [Gaertneriomyces semiglobifer]|nr:hypothetical protein BC832DRAFT_354359 [Gaertneriomyces semiglobifer]